MADDYATYVYERYEGEVFGEAFFDAMADAASDPGNAGKLRVLAQLERETKERLRPEVEATGGDATENPTRLEEAAKVGAQLGANPWADLMGGMVPQLESYVAEFTRCEWLAPAGKEALLRHVTAHEQALLDFARAEFAGDKGDSLAPVLALLVKPPAV